MDITEIKIDYEPDSDHSQLKIWDNIKCHCGGSEDESKSDSESYSKSNSKSQDYDKSNDDDIDSCDNKYPSRDEIITMRLCGDPQGLFQNGDKYFYSTYM